MIHKYFLLRLSVIRGLPPLGVVHFRLALRSSESYNDANLWRLLVQIAKVLIPNAHLPILDYTIPQNTNLVVGALVSVSIRNKVVIGVVCAIEQNSNLGSNKQLKSIEEIHEIRIDNDILSFLNKASEYYLVNIGALAKLMLPVSFPMHYTKKEALKYPNITLPALSPSQNDALHSIMHDNNDIFLLKGITGSGKTEIYFHKIASILADGGQALLMLPEIALSTQIISRFCERFGFEPSVWHSKISMSKKRKLLQGIISGSTSIVIGTRSALFLPYRNLRIIIVDEEHDPSYKQDEGVMYNARDMAVLRGSMMKHKVILGSATPSIETLHNAKIGKYKIVELPSRFGTAVLPDVHMVNMRKQSLSKDSWISTELESAIRSTIAKGSQVMLFLNRRGYAPILLCTLCGHRVSCPSCSSCLVYHKSKKRLECHHCGYVASLKLSCPECKTDDSIVFCGPGTERIEEEVREKFQGAVTQLMTKDELKTGVGIQNIINKIENQEVHILIGTQVITKGYHFPNLNLIGVIDADIAFGGGDLRGAERAFQLLSQVSGRAGRGDSKGTVYLQTYNPESKVLEMLSKHEFEAFIDYELGTRDAAHMPPFTKMAAILLTSSKEADVIIESKNFVKIAPIHEAVRILGPAPATLSKIRNKYRYRILVIADRKIDIQKYLTHWLKSYKFSSKVHAKIDIDPYNLN